MNISRELLKLVVCPVTKGKLIYDREHSLLVSADAALGFPIIDGVPILLKHEARRLSPEHINSLLAKKELEEQELLETNEA